MRYCIFIFVSVFVSCNNTDKEYEIILKSLEKNYVAISNVPKKDILFCWNVNQLTFLKDSIEYRKGIDSFYKQGIPFIKYLLENKNQGNKFNNWIVTKNPCSSNLSKEDFISNSRASMILIDNILVGDKKNIIINNYVSNVERKEVEKILNKSDVKDFKAFKKDYIKYVNTLK